ncbi:MAG: branched-chain amino acid ABC transporter permease [Alphaproteobacteria bacterium]|nr:branched-chain amino acid ABC transporter permease [Pseudorhizobium marinum]MBU1312416.1 branched-chain amino acid ABC transporter permease [Alphaproteobacteria bacterium]MBU1553057.1 branched-chain amino acid ABC transporter permease [Alphaproteobacteria bacterium]MBU2338032.1 branched-chain amino acid ABC transporter permease [Alphaproteobacteria bacterium]MBU2386585.1 branched-chain amino acid ABC transporter permease [Alphaproteobacteria bacterium]
MSVITREDVAPVEDGQDDQARAMRLMRRRSRIRFFEFIIWPAAVAAIFLLPSKMLILTEIAILALFAVSLDLVLGFAGIVSLGHTAFFGIGAYTAGLFARHYFAEPVTGLLVAGVVSGILGFATSFLILRGSDLTRLMTTLGIALMLGEAANQMGWLTGGADGLSGFSLGPILGLFEFDLWGRNGYIYCLAVLFVTTMVARRIAFSPFGLALKAIKSNSTRAALVGVPARRRLVIAYTIAAVMAGFAGALLTQTTSFVSPDVLAFHRSADVLLILVIGGTGYLYGGIFGAIGFTLLKDWLSVVTPQYWMFWIGLLLVILVLVGRGRIARWIEYIPQRLTAAMGGKP